MMALLPRAPPVRMIDVPRLLIVVFDGFQSLDAFGPLEVFRGAGYDVTMAAPHGGVVTASNGVQISVPRSLGAVRGPLDTMLVVGGDGTRHLDNRQLVARHVARLAPRCRRVASVCTGAFILAEAGLLDGATAATHWAYADTLANEYPAVEVDRDSIYVRHGNVWTSAGVTAGMDLALAMVEQDRGAAVARKIAQHLVLYLQRPGGQSQFSALLPTDAGQARRLPELAVWIRANLGQPLTAAVLAERAAMSERSLARAFRAEYDTTPAGFVEACRVDAARGLLETTDSTTAAVARGVGFGTTETFHRAFLRVVGITPAAYRQRFRGTRAAS